MPGTNKVGEIELLEELDALCKQATTPPEDWGGAISVADTTAKMGNKVSGGAFWIRVKALCDDGSIRHGRYRYKGDRKRMLLSVADVVKCVKEGKLR